MSDWVIEWVELRGLTSKWVILVSEGEGVCDWTSEWVIGWVEVKKDLQESELSSE